MAQPGFAVPIISSQTCAGFKLVDVYAIDPFNPTQYMFRDSIENNEYHSRILYKGCQAISRGGTHEKILVNQFPPFFSPQLNLWSCRRNHFFLFWQASRLFQKKDEAPEARRSAKNAIRPPPLIIADGARIHDVFILAHRFW